MGYVLRHAERSESGISMQVGLGTGVVSWPIVKAGRDES